MAAAKDVDERLALIRVVPKLGEGDDANAPKNLHNGAELFLNTDRAASAIRLQVCVRSFFGLFEGGPREDTIIGQASVCWNCGHVGLPATAALKCSHCGDESQANLVEVALTNGTVVPWVQKAPAGQPPASGDKPVASSDAPSPADGLEGFDDRLFSLEVVPNANEADHPSFPRNAYHALELLMHVGHLECARRLQQCTTVYFSVLEAGPKPDLQMGQARLCFDCGHCGLLGEAARARADGEAGMAELADSGAKEEVGACSQCLANSHVNKVRVVLPGGRLVPWMQRDEAAAAAA